MSILAWIVVGAIAGFVASRVVPGDEGYGVLGGLIAGIVGALLGGFLFGIVTGEEFMDDLTIGTVIAAIIGAIIVVYAFSMFNKRGGTRAV
jgi:uncharacterized membrane protein YeaQ/YmgE (transglycosylase-associated protein family)